MQSGKGTWPWLPLTWRPKGMVWLHRPPPRLWRAVASSLSPSYSWQVMSCLGSLPCRWPLPLCPGTEPEFQEEIGQALSGARSQLVGQLVQRILSEGKCNWGWGLASSLLRVRLTAALGWTTGRYLPWPWLGWSTIASMGWSSSRSSSRTCMSGHSGGREWLRWRLTLKMRSMEARLRGLMF